MSELIDMLSNYESFSALSSFKEPNNIIDLENNKNISILRCPVCYKIAKIYCDFIKHIYFTTCDSSHKIENDTFESFLENSNKDISKILCNICQKNEEDFSKMFKCVDCNLFFCSECKSKHNEEKNHLKYISLDKIDNYCEKHDKLFNYYDNEKKANICETCYEENIKTNPKYKNYIIEKSKYSNFGDKINEVYKKSLESIKMWENTSRLIKDWLQNILNKYNEFMISISNYCTLQYNIVSFLNNENNYEKYKNNFNTYYTYEAINNEKIDNYIRYLNDHLNKNYNKNDNIYNMSHFFLEVLDDYNKKDINVESKKSLKFTTGKSNQILPILYSNKQIDDDNKNKVEFMEEKQYYCKSSVECFIPFKENKYLILGLNTGKIFVYEEEEKKVGDEKENEKNNDENNLSQKLIIEEFKNPIKCLCVIDEDKIVVSDIKNIIKIIQIENNMKSYTLLQNIELLENSGNINTIVCLPIFSYYKNRHVFCIGDENNILIYKSNKMPKDLKPPGLNYKERIEDYTIVQPTLYNESIFNKNPQDYEKIIAHNKEPINFYLEKTINVNTSVNCLIEINEKYMAATNPKKNKIRIYQTQEGFKQENAISGFFPCEGNCVLKVTTDRKKLFVGCENGVCLIYIDNLKKYNKYQLGQKIEYLGLYKDDIITCISLKKEDIFLKQYKNIIDSKEFFKYSQVKLNYSKKIIDFKIIGKKIYFIDDSKNIHYYQQHF